MLALHPVREAHRRGYAVVVAAVLAAAPVPVARAQGPAVVAASSLPVVEANDNRRAAGQSASGTVDLVLIARVGRWYPDGTRRPAPLLVPVFAEGRGVPSIPGPLLRVRTGTRVRVTVQNALDGPLAGVPLIVHGLYSRVTPGRDSAGVAPLLVAPGGTRQVVFRAGAPGTYHYWAALTDSEAVDVREGVDAALGGAIIVDPAVGPIPPDRVFVLTRMVLPAEGVGPTRQPGRMAVAVNGLSWPLTERLDVTVGDTVRWRWINLTSDHHPMHLHGFHYRVAALGDERADTLYAPADRPLVVTQRIAEGGTMAMTWVPERAGHWLMHCHIRVHSGPDSTWGFPDVRGTEGFGRAVMAARGVEERASVGNAGRTVPVAIPPAAYDGSPVARRGVSHDMAHDMAGLVLGIRVHPRPGRPTARSVASSGARDRRSTHDVRLTVSEAPTVAGELRRIAVRVDDQGPERGRTSGGSSGIGPPIVLRRGEPTRITVVNHLTEATALHWHGIELESYYDGAPGWTGGPGGGGPDGRLSPSVAPGDSFVAHMTPPRAGTFIYHSHAITTSQEGDGLYGALVVLDSGETYAPAREVTWIVAGRDRGGADRGFLLLNGARAPAPVTLVTGQRYRVRLINITEDNTADVALLDGEASDAAPVVWRPLAKDAVALLGARATARPARLRTSVGETYDFELVPPRPGVLSLQVRNGGDLMARQRVLVR